ncbi:cecropin-D-like peptide [Aphomia sociella]
MKFSRIFFVFFACAMLFTTTSAAPENFFKEIERAGQRIRDAIISAAPAIETVAQAQKIIKGGD